MADKTDDLLISVSTDLTTIKRQLKQLGQDIGTTTGGIQKQFDGLGKGIDQSLSPVQKRINDMMGIANTGAKPLKEWKGALADAAAGFTLTGKSASITANQMLNLSRQGNDVITMFALGAKPMQIFASQAGQIYGALQEGPGGVSGSLKGLGAQAVALATKFPLATAAIAAAGVALSVYALSGGNNIRSLDEILKSHAENIKRLGDAYDQVVGKQQKYAQISAGTASLINEKDLADAKAKLQTAVNDIFSTVFTQSGVGRGGGTREFIKSAFAPFQEAIDNLKNSAKDTTDLRAFTDAVTAIANADPSLKGPAQQLLDFSKGALDAAAAVETVGGVIPDAVDMVSEFQRALANVDSKSAQKELQDLFDKARDGTASADEVRAALDNLSATNLNLAGPIAELGKFYAAAIAARNATAQVLSPLGTIPPVYSGGGGFQNEDQVQTDRANATKSQFQIEQEKLAKKNHGSKAPKKTADDRFANDLQAIKDRTAALAQEAAMVGLSDEEQTKRSTALGLEQQALKQVREEARKKGDADWQNAQLSPQQIAAIDAQSEAYAHQKEILKELQDQYDFQKDVLKGVFDDLRSALDDGKLDWQDFGKIAEDVLDKIIDKIENDLVNAILEASTSGGSGGGGFLGSILGALTGGGGGSDPGIIGALGLRANGGPVSAGQPYIVGEKMPELFVPNQSGTIVPRVPSIQAGGGGTQANITFAPQITVQGNGNGDAGQQVTAALKAYQKDFTPNVLKALREAKQRGMV